MIKIITKVLLSLTVLILDCIQVVLYLRWLDKSDFVGLEPYFILGWPVAILGATHIGFFLIWRRWSRE